MAKKKTAKAKVTGKSGKSSSMFDGIVVKREVDAEGYLHGYDKNDRTCWGNLSSERVVLLHDLRKYGTGLHIGQLGWTIPGTTDGYKWIDVRFDNNITLPILTFGIERVVPEQAAEISRKLIDKHRNTRFDADPVIAGIKHKEWIRGEYEAYVSFNQMAEEGSGDQELYAFTFPSLQTIAKLEHRDFYPVKIGFTTDKDGGAMQRIRSQIIEAAAFPEKPAVLLVWHTWNGRQFEAAVHNFLKGEKRHDVTALGVEWFMTNKDELLALCNRFHHEISKPDTKPLFGASPTIGECLGNNMQIERVDYPSTACVGIRIIQKDDNNCKST
jgi:hypothetical protein